MIGLMLKDILSLRKYFLRQVLYLTVVYIILAITILHSISFVSTMLVMSVMMMLISSFSLDEASKWDAYALTLPVTHRSIVGAKYLLFFGFLAVTAALTSVICGVVDMFTFHEGWLEIAASTGAIVVLYSLTASLFLPLLYKVGVEKARITMSLCFLVPFMGIFWAMSYFSQQTESAQRILDFLDRLSWPLVIVAGLLVLVLLAFGSFALSAKFYEEKEF